MNKIILSIIALVYFLTLQHAQGLIMGHPLEFWDSADIILDGVVISTHLNETDKLVQHDVRVEQYFKNPKPQKMITVYGPDAYNEDWFYPKFFEEGDRALFYLKKVDDKYIILEHSVKATQECSPRDMIGLSTLPGEPIGRGGPTLFFDPYQTCNGYLYSVDYLSRTLKPLKQFEAGIKLEDIQCKDGLKLAIKARDGSPACVKQTSLNRLWVQGWISKSTDIYTKYANPEILQKFQLKIISRDRALEIVNNYIKENKIILDVDKTKPDFRIDASLNYVLLTRGYSYLLDVDPKTGLPLQIMPPWWEQYYRNPQWWNELQKHYLGMENNRIEDGNLAWAVDYRDCLNCVAHYPSFALDAISGKIIRDDSTPP